VRSWLAVVAGVLAGLVAGGIWTWAQPDRYRADARVLVRPDSSRIIPAVQALAESSLVAANVHQTLRLSSPPHVSAKTGKGGVLTVSVEAGSRERARQIDAEAVVVLTQKVAQRFATIVDVTATVLDPAHAAKQTSPTPGRNLLITGLAGLIAGLAVAAGVAQGRRAPPDRASNTVLLAPAGAADPEAERRLQARIDEVAKRERALARRAGELAAREQELERAAPAPVAEPSKPAESAQAAPQPVSGGWNLRVLERLVDEHRAANPAAAEEWSNYLFFLRGHADADGVLPPSFNDLIADVFGNLPGLLRE
jgi:capsular polysaccharide biosynthesis protein